MQALRYKIALLIFFLALIARIALFPFPLYDPIPKETAGTVAFDGYFELAENIIEGNGFTRSKEAPYEPDSVRTPLYPYLVAGLVKLFGNYLPLFLLQILLGSITAVFAWMIAKEFLSDGASLFVGILAAIEPLTAYLSGTIMTETVFSFLFLLAIILLLKFFEKRRLAVLVGAALLLGVATLIKPTVQYFPLLLFIVFLPLFGKDWKKLVGYTLTFTLFFVFVLLPWSIRNYQVFGTTSLVVQPVSNMYAYLVPSTIALEQDISYEEAASTFFEREGVESIEDVNLGNAAEFKKRAMEELRQHPRGFLLSVGVTFFTFFTHDTYATILDRFGLPIAFSHPPLTLLATNPAAALTFAAEMMMRPEAFVLLGRLFWFAIALLSAVGVILYTKRHGITPRLLLVAGLVGYFAATTILIGLAVNGRFRVPVDPFIFIFAIYVLETMLKKRPDSDKPVT